MRDERHEWQHCDLNNGGPAARLAIVESCPSLDLTEGRYYLFL